MVKVVGENKFAKKFKGTETTAVVEKVKDGVIPSFNTEWAMIKSVAKSSGCGFDSLGFEIMLIHLPSNGYICNLPFEVDKNGEKKPYTKKQQGKDTAGKFSNVDGSSRAESREPLRQAGWGDFQRATTC